MRLFIPLLAAVIATSALAAPAQSDDLALDYFRGTWHCGAQQLLFTPSDYRFFRIDFDTGSGTHAHANFGAPAMRYLAPPVDPPEFSLDDPQPTRKSFADAFPKFVYSGYVYADVAKSRFVSTGPTAAGVWTWNQRSAYEPGDAVMIWTTTDQTTFTRTLGLRNADGSVRVTFHDTCIKDPPAAVRESGSTLDFSFLHFPSLDRSPSPFGDCVGGVIMAPVFPFTYRPYAYDRVPGQTTLAIDLDGDAPPGVVEAIAVFAFDDGPPLYLAGGDRKRVLIPDVEPGDHPFWIGTLYVMPSGDVREMVTESWCARILPPTPAGHVDSGPPRHGLFSNGPAVRLAKLRFPKSNDCVDRRQASSGNASATIAFAKRETTAIDVSMSSDDLSQNHSYVYIKMDAGHPIAIWFDRPEKRTVVFPGLNPGPHRALLATLDQVGNDLRQRDSFPLCFAVSAE